MLSDDEKALVRRERRVNAIAQRLWREAGYPAGQYEKHRQQAEVEADAVVQPPVPPLLPE